MATIKALIRTTKKEGNANVRFRISDGRSVQLWYNSEIEVRIDLWDPVKEKIKERKACDEFYRYRVNNAVEERKALLLDVYKNNRENITTSDKLEEYVDCVIHPEAHLTEFEKTHYDFFEAFNLYLERTEHVDLEKRCFQTLERILVRYEMFIQKMKDPGFKLDIYTMTRLQINDIQSYVRTEDQLVVEYPAVYKLIFNVYPSTVTCKKSNKKFRIQKRGRNTVLKTMNRLKTFFKWLNAEGITDNRPFEGVKLGQPLFGTPYYLTTAERDKIANFDFASDTKLEIIRDIFIFQCYIGCRVGDLIKMTKDNIIGDAIEYIPHKTKDKKPRVVHVPLHPVALKIVEKYKFFREKTGELLPFYTPQKYNENLKKVFEECGITRVVTILDPKTNEEIKRPLNEIASSHLARRTFCGNLYKKVKDPNLVASLSGHSENSRAFARYRTIDEEMQHELINML